MRSRVSCQSRQEKLAPWKREPYVGAGTPEDLAQAMIDGKPVSPKLAGMYARVLRETIAELAKEHGIEMPKADDVG